MKANDNLKQNYKNADKMCKIKAKKIVNKSSRMKKTNTKSKNKVNNLY